MQREHLRRGFSIHQKVVLEIDFSGSIWGYTDITVVPVAKDLRTVHLHSRQCTIQSVTVASRPADFVHHDPLATISISNPQDCHTHLELKRRVYSALAEGDEGELSIAIPKEVIIRQSANSTISGIVSETATPEPQTPGPLVQPVAPIFEFAPIIIRIVYSLRSPADGVQFIIPNETYPYRVPHVYTTPSSPDAARCWVPCIDNLWEKCTWEFEFIVPRYLEQLEDGSGSEDSEGDYPTVVVCSGDFIAQVAHPHNSNKTIFLFSQTTLTSIQHVAFAAGPFHVQAIPADLSSVEDASGSSQPLMHALCLPGHEAMLKSSVISMRAAMSFYVTEYGSYPFGSYKMVFVDELPTQRFDSATFSILTSDLLHGDDAIDQVFETRHCLSHALACQWVGINIHQKTWSDTWLVNGLGLYITGLFTRKLFGNNEYRFRLKKDMERILDLDVGPMPPICQPQLMDPPDAATLPFVNLKAPLVLHILDRRLGKSGTSLGLSRVLPKLFLSATSGEMLNNSLSTHSFLRMCRKVSGIDPRAFAEQWIYGSGCPTFGFSANFNRKKMAVEITMRQDAAALKYHEGNEVAKQLMKPVPFFEGQMTIRIHEADGTPYEHVLDIRSAFKRYEVPFNTKYKRVRRNTKRYLARQQAAQAAAEGDAEAAAAMDMVDMGFGLEIWEKEKERENWKVADWTEEDEQNMSGQTYEWIRIDADFEWIATIAFDQKDYMWVSQLQRDRDVVAQYEAIQVLAKTPNAIISSTFTKTVLVTNYFFRIRCEAAQALVTCAVQRLDWLGLFHLFKLFLRYCYEPEDPNQDLFTHSYIPRPNDFSDFAEYFVRRSLLRSISRVRFGNGKTPPVVRQFLIDQLRYNDNTLNPYSDALYICTIISALASATVSAVAPERGQFTVENQPLMDDQDTELLKQALAEIDRYRSMDRLIPSQHNVVTTAAIEFYIGLGMAGLISHDPRLFFPVTREGNYIQVRMVAFDALFLSKWYTPKIMQYVLAVMANDSSRVIRRHVARGACQSLALLVTMGEMKTSARESETLLIEEDGTALEGKKEQKKSDIELLIKALRKDREVGKNEAIREYLIPIAMASDADHEVRWWLLKLADLLIRGAEEAPPKVTIHLPPTPVTETPPPLPTVKLPVKQRPLKSVTSSSSPLAPFAAPPKLKLPVNGAQSETNKVPMPVAPAISETKTAPPHAPKKPVQRKAPGANPKVPKAQAGGMNLPDVKASRVALKKLQGNTHAPVFLQPVDPVRDKAPNYFDIIKHPMDLQTMNAKLEQGQYRNRFDFEADFRLMISNAKQYNMPNSYVHNEALALESFFDRQWVVINKTLEANDQKVHAQPPLPIVPSTPALKLLPVLQADTPIQATSTPTAPPRPIIKLKVASSTASTQNDVPPPTTPAPEPSRAGAKLKVKKPKELKSNKATSTDLAYMDDGSADLLEEVIAIEREKDEEMARKRASEEAERRKERDKQVAPKLVIGKRKKEVVDGAREDDEILALATPAKKERSAPSSPPIAGASSAPAVEQTPKPVALSITPAPTLKLTLAKNKARPTKAAPIPAAPTPSAPEPPREPKEPVRKKGKEKEAVVPTPLIPVKRKSPVVQTTPINEKKCREVLRVLTKLTDAVLFLAPVDPVRDGCPSYYDEIKNPMDFGTMSTKLNEHQYLSMEDFAKDMDLVFNNCRTFNPPTTYPVNCANAVEKVFRREWMKATEKKLSWNEKRSLQSVMNKLVQDPISFVFREPVDPVALQIPTYHDIIPKKDARDLRTIRQKLDVDKYDTVEAFEADMDLMISNAILFNGPESEVGQVSAMIKEKYKDMLSTLKLGGNTKRKGGDKGTPQPAKKVKIG